MRILLSALFFYFLSLSLNAEKIYPITKKELFCEVVNASHILSLKEIHENLTLDIIGEKFTVKIDDAKPNSQCTNVNKNGRPTNNYKYYPLCYSEYTKEMTFPNNFWGLIPLVVNTKKLYSDGTGVFINGGGGYIIGEFTYASLSRPSELIFNHYNAGNGRNMISIISKCQKID